MTLVFAPRILTHFWEYLGSVEPFFGNELGSTFLGRVITAEGWRPGFPRELFLLHMGASFVCVVAACVQALPSLRREHPGIHRRVGIAYIFAVPVAAGPAIVVGLYNYAGMSVHVAFAVSSVLWILFTLIAYAEILRRNYLGHRDWMIRSMCMMVAAPLERLSLLGWALVVSGSGMGYPMWRSITIWINLALVLALGQVIVLYLRGRLLPVSLSPQQQSFNGGDHV